MDIGELRAKITASVDDFEKGLKDAGKSVDDFTDKTDKGSKKASASTKTLGDRLKALSSPMKQVAKVATGVVAALTAVAVATIKVTDEQIKLARQMGLTNEEFQVLKRAADLAGLGVNELERNMYEFNRRLREAGEEGTKTANALESIGLSVEDLAGMKPEDQMVALGKALEGVSDNTEKTAIAVELFGSRGRTMLNLLADAEGSFNRARDEVDRFGLALSAVDSAKIEQANDDISGMALSFRGLAQEFAVQVSPAMSRITTVIATWVAGLTQSIRLARIQKDLMSDAYLTDKEVAELKKEIADLEKKRADNMAEYLKLEAMQAGAGKHFREQARAYLEERDAKEALLNIDRERKRLRDEEGKAIPVVMDIATIPTKTDDLIDNNETLLAIDKEFYDARLDSLKQSLFTEEEALQHQLDTRRGIIQDFYEKGEIDEQEHNELMLSIAQDYMDKQAEIRKRGLTEIERFQAMSWANQTMQVTEELAGLTRNLDSSNKEQFKIMKAGAIAQAIVNTYKGISQSLGAYPMPLAGIMAAAHALSGWAQVNNIRKQSFGGGGGGSSYSAPASPVATPHAQADRQRESQVTINLHGETYQRQDVATLIENINEAVGDGSRIRIA